MNTNVINTLKNTNLTLASNLREDNFFWIYYAGMGDRGIHHIQEKETLQSIENELLNGQLVISDEIIYLPLYLDTSVKTVKVKKVILNDRDKT